MAHTQNLAQELDPNFPAESVLKYIILAENRWSPTKKRKGLHQNSNGFSGQIPNTSENFKHDFH